MSGLRKLRRSLYLIAAVGIALTAGSLAGSGGGGGGYINHSSPTYTLMSTAQRADFSPFWAIQWSAYSWVQYASLTETSIDVKNVFLSFHVDDYEIPAGLTLDCNPQYTSPMPTLGGANYQVNADSPFPRGSGSGYWYLSSISWDATFDKSQHPFSLLNSAGPQWGWYQYEYNEGWTCDAAPKWNLEIEGANTGVFCWFSKIGQQTF